MLWCRKALSSTGGEGMLGVLGGEGSCRRWGLATSAPASEDANIVEIVWNTMGVCDADALAKEMARAEEEGVSTAANHVGLEASWMTRG
jgi:hypothetical protein